jgi:ABC-type glycerol-3-phosphate transport system substrate-binding protein
MTVIDDEGADAAIALAKYMTADDGTSLALFKGIGLPPATTSGQSIPEVAADAYTTAWTTEVTAFADIKPFAQFPEVLRFEGMVGDAVQQVLLGAMPAREALEACAEEIREVIG